MGGWKSFLKSCLCPSKLFKSDACIYVKPGMQHSCMKGWMLLIKQIHWVTIIDGSQFHGFRIRVSSKFKPRALEKSLKKKKKDAAEAAEWVSSTIAGLLAGCRCGQLCEWVHDADPSVPISPCFSAWIDFGCELYFLMVGFALELQPWRRDHQSICICCSGNSSFIDDGLLEMYFLTRRLDIFLQGCSSGKKQRTNRHGMGICTGACAFSIIYGPGLDHFFQMDIESKRTDWFNAIGHPWPMYNSPPLAVGSLPPYERGRCIMPGREPELHGFARMVGNGVGDPSMWC